MKVFTIHQAKASLAKLIEAACRGEEVVIARGSEPVVRLVPISDPKGPRKPGALRGRFYVGSEFFEPLTDEETSDEA